MVAVSRRVPREDHPGFHARVETLVCSIRALAGDLSHMPIVVLCLGSADRAFASRMRDAEAEVRVIAPFADRRPAHANKLAMLELCHENDFDVLLALDCDVAVARDPSEFLRTDAVVLAPADIDPLGERRWRALFECAQVASGERSLLSTAHGRPMYPYFNSGVLAVPRPVGLELAQAWRRALADIERIFERHARIVPRSKRFYADQLALALALRRGLPWRAANPELNFPTHLRLHEPLVKDMSPAIIHYHGEVDRDGFLLRPRCPVADVAAEVVNRARAANRGAAYDRLKSRPAPVILYRACRSRAASAFADLAR
jgi:hypothetical protein